jgi:hypothetical protein
MAASSAVRGLKPRGARLPSLEEPRRGWRPMMGLSRLTLLGYGILAWSGVVGLGAIALAAHGYAAWLAWIAMLGATGGLATAVVGAARHDVI